MNLKDGCCMSLDHVYLSDKLGLRASHSIAAECNQRKHIYIKQINNTKFTVGPRVL